MQISYGPPAHHGVTSLMAVGDDEYGEAIEKSLRRGEILALAAWGVGLLMGNASLRTMGIGAGLGFFGVRLMSDRLKQQKVEVTAPASTGCLPCIL